MRILFVTAPAQVGGLEAVVQMLSAGLVRRGHAVLVVGVTGSADDAREFFDGLRAAGVSSQQILIAGRDYRGEQKLIGECIRVFLPEVVHTHGYRCDVLAGSAARKKHIPTVSTAHGYSGAGLRNRFYQWLQERALRTFDAVATVSTPLYERLGRAGVPASRLHLVRNAFRRDMPSIPREAARQQLGIGASEFVVGWVGRLAGEKGPDVLLRAAELRSTDGISFSIIGDGPLERELRQKAVNSQLSNVRFHGRVSNAASRLGAFDAVALTSRTEGTPIVLLEAMAARVPIVATRVGGVPDMLSEDEAILVPSEDAEAVGAGLQRLHSDSDLGRSLAANAHARLVRDFDFDKWISSYLALYKSVSRAQAGNL